MRSNDVGHRQRLRERFLSGYGVGMQDYEILELFLTYAIPRKDVKPVAKSLMERFGNLNGVLDASSDELLQICEIGDSSLVLMKLVKEICGKYLAERMHQRDLLTSPDRVVNYARMKLAGLPHEAFMVIYLNTQNELINHGIVNEGTVDQVAVYPRRIVEKALAHHAAGLIIIHNHPSGHTEPSEDDKRLTRILKESAKLLDIRVLDHVIVGRGGYFSFLERGII